MLWHKNSKPILETGLGRAFLYTSLFFVTLSCALLFCTALLFTAFGFIEYSGRLQCLGSQIGQRQPNLSPDPNLSERQKKPKWIAEL